MKNCEGILSLFGPGVMENSKVLPSISSLYDQIEPSKSKNTKEKQKSSTKTTKKVKFTPEEDERLRVLVEKYGTRNWTAVAEDMEGRNPRQCRERWNNYVNPSLRADPWSIEEDKLLVDKYAEFGSHWNKMAKFFPTRSDNSIRNRWQLLCRHWERHSCDSSPPQSAE